MLLILSDLEKNHSENLAFLNKEKIIDALNELKNTPAGLDNLLSRCVRYGIAFHHAGCKSSLGNLFCQTCTLD